MQPLLCFGRAAVPHREKSQEKESEAGKGKKNEKSLSRSPVPVLVTDCRGPEKLDWDACTPSPEPKIASKDPPVMVFDCTTTSCTVSPATTIPGRQLTADEEIDRRIDEMTRIAMVMKEKESEDKTRRDRLEQAFRTLINQSKKMDGEMRAFFTDSSSPDVEAEERVTSQSRSPSPYLAPHHPSNVSRVTVDTDSKLQEAINNYVIVPPIKRILRPTPSVEGIHSSMNSMNSITSKPSESPIRSPFQQRIIANKQSTSPPLSGYSASVSRHVESSSPGYRTSPMVRPRQSSRSSSRAPSLKRREVVQKENDDDIRFDPDVIEETLRPTKWGRAVVDYPSRQSSPSCASPPRKSKTSVRRPLRDRSNSIATTPVSERLTVVGEVVRPSPSPFSVTKSLSILSWDPVESIRRNKSSGGRTPQRGEDLPKSPSTRPRRNSVNSCDGTPTRLLKQKSKYRNDSPAGPGPAAYRPRSSFNAHSPSPRFSSSARF